MKTLYIYEDVEAATSNWHNRAGVVVISEGDPSDDWKDYLARLADWEREGVRLSLPASDRVIPVGDDEPSKVYVFPDAGCC